MNDLSHLEPDYSEFVEVDPTGRYGRYNEILGKGASKTVYRAFDEYEGIEVAWNQVKVYAFLQSPEDLERLYCEIHLLKTLKHKNIMKFYTSWVDTAKRNINFVTEMFTSGTLRQYREKHKRVNIRAVKHWCRQILKGLIYLHSHDPPVIHRDLKCDNIFVNGHHGEVKIGDLGLAAILRKSDPAHCVGTPEFMAPEVYKEEYNELVDIYAFGMCILEMVTFEYPYSECTHPAQIYKKVISGKKPDALYKVKDPEVRRFVEKCLVTASRRLPAKELLKDPFLQIDDCTSDLRPIEHTRNYNEMNPLLRRPLFQHRRKNSWFNVYSKEQNDTVQPENGWQFHPVDMETNGIELFTYNDDDPPDVDITIKGRLKDDNSIFLRLRIADKEGRIRNIYFPFDIETDTALSVATEMIAELDITDQDVTKIANMIDGEIVSLVPEWETGPCIQETPRYTNATYCENCASNRTSTGSLMDYLSNSGLKNVQIVPCSQHGCAAMRGRFEEITYQVEGSEHFVTSGAPLKASHSDTNIFAQHDVKSEGLVEAHSDEEHQARSSPQSLLIEDDYENEIRQELRWVKAKYQMELRELKNLNLGHSNAPSWSPGSYNMEHLIQDMVTCSPVSTPMSVERSKLFESFASGTHLSCYYTLNQTSCPDSDTQRVRHCEATTRILSPMQTTKSFYTGKLLPQSLQRTTSLPVDAVDV